MSLKKLYLELAQEREQDQKAAEDQIKTFEELYNTKKTLRPNLKEILNELYQERDYNARQVKFYRKLYQKCEEGE